MKVILTSDVDKLGKSGELKAVADGYAQNFLIPRKLAVPAAGVAYRAWQRGWRVMYYPEAQIVHHHQAKSDNALLSRYSWYHLRGMWRFYRKHRAPSWLRLAVEPEKLS